MKNLKSILWKVNWGISPSGQRHNFAIKVESISQTSDGQNMVESRYGTSPWLFLSYLKYSKETGEGDSRTLWLP